MRKGLLIIAVLFRSASCWAHVFPVSSDPRVGATVMTAPMQVSILFDGKIEPVFSTIEVISKDKIQVDKKDSHIDGVDADKLVVSLLPALSAGKYHVEWKAVARDGHLTTGHFFFWITEKNS